MEADAGATEAVPGERGRAMPALPVTVWGKAVSRRAVGLAVVAMAEAEGQTIRKCPSPHSNQPVRLPEEYAGVVQGAP